MARVQLTCPETGKPVDILEVPAGAFQAAVLSSTEIPCPHSGKNHRWTSGDLGLAMRALHDSPERAAYSSRLARQRLFYRATLVCASVPE
jgi:hypothetical protein